VTWPPKQRRCEGGRALAGIAICACLAASCGGSGDATPALAVKPAAAVPAAGGTVPHGDHNPRYGGLVLMNGDLHFEIVAGRDGAYRLYFSDATRQELPAATASNVTITVTQRSHPPEAIALHIDDSGESWTGRGHPLDDPAATLRVAYTAGGTPYFIDVPVPH
jgi:hypothetical protein